MSLSEIIKGSSIRRSALAAVLSAGVYLASPQAVAGETAVEIAAKQVSNVKVTFPWKSPETAAEKKIYNSLLDRMGEVKADLKFMEYQRLKKAGVFGKKTLETLIETPDSKILNADGWYKLITGEDGKLLKEVSGKIKVNGTEMSVSETLDYMGRNKTRFQFMQETSQGLKIELGEYLPKNTMNAIMEHTKISKENTLVPKKYKVLIEDLDSKKVFDSIKEAESYASKLEKEGYDARVVDKEYADTLDRRETIREKLKDMKPKKTETNAKPAKTNPKPADTGERYRVFIEGEDSGKLFDSLRSANDYHEKCVKEGFDAKVVDEDYVPKKREQRTYNREKEPAKQESSKTLEEIAELKEEVKKLKSEKEKTRYREPRETYDRTEDNKLLERNDFCTSAGTLKKSGSQVYATKEKEVFSLSDDSIWFIARITGKKYKRWVMRIDAPSGEEIVVDGGVMVCGDYVGGNGLKVKKLINEHGTGEYKVKHYLGKELMDTGKFKIER